MRYHRRFQCNDRPAAPHAGRNLGRKDKGICHFAFFRELGEAAGPVEILTGIRLQAGMLKPEFMKAVSARSQATGR